MLFCTLLAAFLPPPPLFAHPAPISLPARLSRHFQAPFRKRQPLQVADAEQDISDTEPA